MKLVRTVITGSDDGGIERVQRLLDDLAEAHRLPSGPVTDMQVALDEILSNALRNGFNDGLPHRIEVVLAVEPQMLMAEIEDDCAPFDPLSVAEPELKLSLKERGVGGLGIHFVRNLMTDVIYARVGERNRLVLKKNLLESPEEQ